MFFFRLVTRQEKVPMRNGTSDLWIPRSDTLPLSHRDSEVSEVYYEVHMTWGLRTFPLSLARDKAKKISFSISLPSSKLIISLISIFLASHYS